MISTGVITVVCGPARQFSFCVGPLLWRKTLTKNRLHHHWCVMLNEISDWRSTGSRNDNRSMRLDMHTDVMGLWFVVQHGSRLFVLDHYHDTCASQTSPQELPGVCHSARNFQRWWYAQLDLGAMIVLYVWRMLTGVGATVVCSPTKQMSFCVGPLLSQKGKKSKKSSRDLKSRSEQKWSLFSLRRRRYMRMFSLCRAGYFHLSYFVS